MIVTSCLGGMFGKYTRAKNLTTYIYQKGNAESAESMITIIIIILKIKIKKIKNKNKNKKF